MRKAKETKAKGVPTSSGTVVRIEKISNGYMICRQPADYSKPEVKTFSPTDPLKGKNL